MLLLSLMASSQSGCFPGLVLNQERSISMPFKDSPDFLPTIGLGQQVLRSSSLSQTPYEHDDLFKLTELSGYSRFVKTASVLRMPLPGEFSVVSAVRHNDPEVPELLWFGAKFPQKGDKKADYILFSFGIDEQWTKHKKLMQYLVPGVNDLDPSIFPDLVGIQTTPAVMNQLHLDSTEFELNNLLAENTAFLDPNGNYYGLQANPDLICDLPSMALLHADGRLSFVGHMTDMKELVSVLEKFKYTKDPTWRKQLIVPEFRWNDAIQLQGHKYLSSLKLDSMTISPIKRRNLKSVKTSLKKAGSELPLLLTHFSASVTGIGLAFMFSVIIKWACGSIPNILPSGFGVGLFWLSSAVNKLRDTIIYINKSSTKFGVEEELMMRVDSNVNDIFFRAAALMVVLLFRFCLSVNA
ncbi:tRNA modification GTPase MnmE [Bienertia sinuspersici]